MHVYVYSALIAYMITRYNRYFPLYINDINLIPSCFLAPYIQNIYWLFYSSYVYDDAKCCTSKLLLLSIELNCIVLFCFAQHEWILQPH